MAVITSLADVMCKDSRGHPLRVAVDGVTASGKSTLASELADAVSSRGRRAIHLSMDGFHHPRAHRHRQGRFSARGYYYDAYDFAALRDQVLIPLGPGGTGHYRRAVIDLGSDEPCADDPVEAPLDAVLIVDGTFLQRPELVDHWDHRIYLDVALDVALERGVRRDLALLGGRDEAERLYKQRYHAACELYLSDVSPKDRATLVVDNNDPLHPRVLTA